MKHVLLLVLLVPKLSLGQPKYVRLSRFDTLIYQYSITIESGQRVNFPAGCHLYDVTHRSTSGSLKVVFRDGSALYQKAINSTFYIASTPSTYRLVPLKYGDPSWQSSQSAKTVYSVTASDKALFQLTYFTLIPLRSSPTFTFYP